MAITYIYNGEEYKSVYRVRKAIWEKEFIAFPKEPQEGREEFWAKYGVEYKEVEDVKSDEQIIAEFTQVVQHHLDKKAQALNYDSCLSVCSYLNTGNEKFDTEGEAFRVWRSAVWEKCYTVLAEVRAGQRDIPTTEELIEMLPELSITYPEGVSTAAIYAL